MLPNFKALGIEKVMNEEFSNYEESYLQLLMNSCYFTNPFIHNRYSSADYCMIKLVDCQHEEWWYSKLIGLQFFCRIIWDNSITKNKIIEFKGVKLTNTKEIIFRDFNPKRCYNSLI